MGLSSQSHIFKLKFIRIKKMPNDELWSSVKKQAFQIVENNLIKSGDMRNNELISYAYREQFSQYSMWCSTTGHQKMSGVWWPLWHFQGPSSAYWSHCLPLHFSAPMGSIMGGRLAFIFSVYYLYFYVWNSMVPPKKDKRLDDFKRKINEFLECWGKSFFIFLVKPHEKLFNHIFWK